MLYFRPSRLSTKYLNEENSEQKEDSKQTNRSFFNFLFQSEKPQSKLDAVEEVSVAQTEDVDVKIASNMNPFQLLLIHAIETATRLIDDPTLSIQIQGRVEKEDFEISSRGPNDAIEAHILDPSLVPVSAEYELTEEISSENKASILEEDDISQSDSQIEPSFLTDSEIGKWHTAKGIVVFLDCQEVARQSMPSLGIARSIIDILTRHYPKRLATLFLVDPPPSFHALQVLLFGFITS